LFAGASFAPANADVPPKPLDDGNIHLGVASCGGTTCHSRQAATGAIVRQNEIVTWQDRTSVTGAHARAYSVLMSPQGRAIAANLGIPAAEKAPECLSCHTHAVPETRRGEGFSLAEGVTCEACHGGAEKWLVSHYAAGNTHADSLARGLYPTADVEARASLCLDCHFGSDRPDQFVTHRIMGAGHPRMSFELDLFTALQQHHDVDADYLERKAHTGGIKTWAVGQAMAMARSAELFADEETGTDGLFPEFYFFDCHACHQTISNDPKAIAGWRPNPGRPLGPGVPVYNDANMIMLRAVVAELGGDAEASLFRVSTRLHAATASGRPATRDAAAELATFAEDLQSRLLATDFDRGQSVRILNRIIDSALTAQYTNYAAGEQAVIAVDVFLNALVAADQLDVTAADALRPAIDSAYAAVASPNSYDPDALRQALGTIAGRAGTF
jgi:hypothetical protein